MLAKRIVISIVFSGAVFFFSSAVFCDDLQVLGLENPGFEDSKDTPVGWYLVMPSSYRGKLKVLSMEEFSPHSGAQSLMLQPLEHIDPKIGYLALCYSQTKLPLKSGDKVVVSYYCKQTGEGKGDGVLYVVLHGYGPDDKEVWRVWVAGVAKYFKEVSEWKKISAEVVIGTGPKTGLSGESDYPGTVCDPARLNIAHVRYSFQATGAGPFYIDDVIIMRKEKNASRSDALQL